MSDEHIWPQSLGGDPLEGPWRTDKVCIRCNSLAGQFVDAAFVKSWIGSHERGAGTDEYLDPTAPEKAIVPYVYMGPFQHDELCEDEVAEMWLGPAGDVVVHIRSKHDKVWDTYAGGRPSRKKAEAGHAYLGFRSAEPFWAAVAFWSFQKQFRLTRRTLLNADVPSVQPPLTPIDPNDADQARHVRVALSVNGGVNVHVTLPIDLGNRLLVKVALGLGRETLGEDFLKSTYAGHLSRSLWERDPEKRQSIPVLGSGFLGAMADQFQKLPLVWPGGWLLMLILIDGKPSLTVVSPSGKMGCILVSDEAVAEGQSQVWTSEGMVFLAIPAACEATGPIPLPDYLAFVLQYHDHPELKRLNDLRRDPSGLPPKR